MGRPRKQRPVSVEIFLGTDGAWHGYKTVGTRPNGRPDVRHRSAKTREECEAKIRQLEDELAAGTLGKPGRKRHKVKDWFRLWLTDIAPYQASGSRREPLRPKTLRDYRGLCRNWLVPHLGDLYLDQLDGEDLDRLYTAMYEAKRTARTVHNAHSMIRRGLAVALQRGHVARNVAAMRDDPGAPSRRRHSALSQDQARAVLAAIDRLPARERLRWRVGLAIGPRQGETLGLTWGCVDLDEGVVDTSWQIQRRSWQHGCADPYACGARPRPGRPDGLHRQRRPPCPGEGPVHDRYHRRGCPKPVQPCPASCAEHARSCPQRRLDIREGETQLYGAIVRCRKKTFRDDGDQHLVALPSPLVDELRAHHRHQARERLRAGTLWQDYDLVFCQPNGRPIDPRDDWEQWQEVLREAGMAKAGTHVIRATAATMLLDMGVDLAVVQEVLGHRHISTTRGYTAVSVGLTRRAADKMARLFADNTTDLATARERRSAKGGRRASGGG